MGVDDQIGVGGEACFGGGVGMVGFDLAELGELGAGQVGQDLLDGELGALAVGWDLDFGAVGFFCSLVKD